MRPLASSQPLSCLSRLAISDALSGATPPSQGLHLPDARSEMVLAMVCFSETGNRKWGIGNGVSGPSTLFYHFLFPIPYLRLLKPRNARDGRRMGIVERRVQRVRRERG